jgi:SEC-C motif
MSRGFKNQRANDLCQCGSGERYKHCHKPLHRTPQNRYLKVAREFYLKRWLRNAANHASLGHYDWMIDQLPQGGNRILDVGVGDGAGVEALFRKLKPDKIISLEENPVCAQKAKLRLAEAHLGCTIIERMISEQIADAAADYRSTFLRGAITANEQITILLTDPLFDHFLAQDLSAVGPFDVVTAWLLGSHEAREYSIELQQLGVSTTTEYRLRVQNAVYDLADEALGHGGILQIVDRIQHPDLELIRQELFRSHGEQAETTNLRVHSVSFTPYQEASGASVGLMHGETGKVIDLTDAQIYLASIISIKS